MPSNVGDLEKSLRLLSQENKVAELMPLKGFHSNATTYSGLNCKRIAENVESSALCMFNTKQKTIVNSTEPKYPLYSHSV